MSHGFLNMVIFLLAASVLLVPLAQRLGLGSVMGYLLAGVVVGPWALKLVTNVEDIMHFSEFGVVLFLFLIGLEVEIKKLWTLRMQIFGLGGLQVVLCTALISLGFWLSGLDKVAAIIGGMGFALSSTAIVLQLLKERNLLPTTTGQATFSVLLFQDLAIIPMLAILPLLTTSQNSSGGWLSALKTIAILIAVVALSRLLLRHVLRIVAQSHLRDVFTALSLLLVVSMSGLMVYLNLSMGLGAFLAGMLLADSEYRHAVETDIEPFKGLLLGLFFMSVGMSINFGYILINPIWIACVVIGLVLTKFIVHFTLSKFFNIPKSQRIFFSIVLSQVGEFAFVLFGTAQTLGLINSEISGGLMAAVAISMLSTPLLVWMFENIIEKRMTKPNEVPPDLIENQKSTVLIAGFGRFGQIVGRLLYANKISATVLDHEPTQIEMLRRFGFKIYFGDATRVDLLHAAGAADAKILVVAIDDVDDNLQLIDQVKQHYPHLKIVARARNMQHYYELIDRKVQVIEREMFEGSLRLGVEVLKLLGWSAYEAVTAGQRFRKHNIEMIHQIHPNRGNEKDLVSLAKQSREDLEKLFEQERSLREKPDQGWD